MTPPKPPAPTPRLLELRATLEGMCVATEANWFAKHDWSKTRKLTCLRCGISVKEIALVGNIQHE